MKLAIEIYGEEAPMMMAVEECSELIKAICKLFRGDHGGEVDAVAEEIADVQIMMDQLKLMFPSRNIEAIEVKKLERLNRHIRSSTS